MVDGIKEGLLVSIGNQGGVATDKKWCGGLKGNIACFER